MAQFLPFFKKLMLHEGGYVNDPIDKGGPTKYGVILKVWIAKGYDKDKDGDIDIEDLKKITLEDAANIAKPYYWDKLKADQIKSQSVAEFLVDWAYNSGVTIAAKKVQRLLLIPDDGIIGNQSLQSINNADPKLLLEKLKQSRRNFVVSIVNNNPSQRRFLKGWLNRINSFTFES